MLPTSSFTSLQIIHIFFEIHEMKKTTVLSTVCVVWQFISRELSQKWILWSIVAVLLQRIGEVVVGGEYQSSGVSSMPLRLNSSDSFS
jgi:hypothetical protein